MKDLNASLVLQSSLSLGIPPRTAHVLSLLFTSSYVGSIYVSQLFASHLRLGPGQSKLLPIPPISSTDSDAIPEMPTEARRTPEPGSRDHPDTIRTRMKAVGLATVGSLGGVWWTVRRVGGLGLIETAKCTASLLGLSTGPIFRLGKVQLCLSFLLAPALFLGPLYARYLDSRLSFQHPSPAGLLGRIKRWWAEFGPVEIRNYVVGPLTEELVFRSSIISACILAHLSPSSLVFGTPLWFGIAHFHHAYEAWKRGGRTTEVLIQAVATSLFQLTYTTLFGWFASYLFIRTGSVLPPLASHIFCNFMGIYLPQQATARHPRYSTAIWAAYLGGIASFTLGLRAL
ncbi:hypothetical protein BCR39DRAFT_525125 [Naematelia encephala]|uniref:intramembrane prenyl-peptidase Rce1 n=1 Tax=Naematelia encephala TaxID=71784 RepID=A0A1Y2BBZ1_9TREE|nr:hypothetical protein BCR39DRAFT_525125 [Naematelia encephala]